MNSAKSTLTETKILELLSQARHFELCRQLDEGFDCLKPIWADHQEKPLLGGFSAPVQGEILLRTGTFLSYYSFFKQIRALNETARNWLTEAREIFKALAHEDKIAESQMEIGMTYWREGRCDEAKIWLLNALENIRKPLGSVSIKLNSCILLNCHSSGLPAELEYAYQLIKDKDVTIELSQDSRLKVHYYINSAVIMYDLRKYSEAQERYQLAISYAREVGNQIYLAAAYNNIAVAYKELELFDEALAHVDLSIQVSNELGDLGGLAGCYDTKAQIFLAKRDLKRALQFINKAIKILRKGEQYKTLLDALFVRIEILFGLHRNTEALGLFAEIYETAQQRLSEIDAKLYAEKFEKLIYVRAGQNLHDQLFEFERKLISEAISECGGLIIPMTKQLGLTHKSLIGRLKSRFPDLYDQINGNSDSGNKTRRRASKRKIQMLDENSTHIIRQDSTYKINVGSHIVDYPKGCLKPDMYFKIRSNNLGHLGLTSGVIAVVTYKTDFQSKLPFLIKDDAQNSYHAGFLFEQYGLYGLDYENGTEAVPFAVETTKVIGQIIGYCRPRPETMGGGYEFIEL